MKQSLPHFVQNKLMQLHKWLELYIKRQSAHVVSHKKYLQNFPHLMRNPQKWSPKRPLWVENEKHIIHKDWLEKGTWLDETIVATEFS